MEQREGITMYRIFIVEDDEIISEVLKKNLSSWGYDVSCAERSPAGPAGSEAAFL